MRMKVEARFFAIPAGADLVANIGPGRMSRARTNERHIGPYSFRPYYSAASKVPHGLELSAVQNE